MGTRRDYYEQWFSKRGRPRIAADEAAALRAADAFDEMERSGQPSQAALGVVIDAAGSPRRLVSDCAVDLLMMSLRRWPGVADSLSAMMGHPSATTRFSAMCCVRELMPLPVADRMIEAGLTDKSGRVRWKAAEAACSLKRSAFVPAIERAMAKEKPGRTRDSLEHSLRMLRDGYILRPMGDGTYSLWIQTGRGTAGTSVTEDDLEAKAVAALVAEFREELE